MSYFKLKLMKAYIEINGQISGNFTLRRKLVNCDGSGEVKQTMFNGFIIAFNTLGQAKKAIRNAYKVLIDEEPEMKNRIDGIYMIDNERLYYGASAAKVCKGSIV